MRCRLGRMVLSLAILLNGWGCDEPEGTSGVERTRVGDTLFVHSHRPEYPDTVPMREVMRIGMLDGPEEYMFGSSIYSFAVGSDGDVFVADQAGIRHYGPEGSFLGWLAHQGEGPWEVKVAVAMDVSPEGFVAAQDVRNSRISIFYHGDSVAHVRGPDGRAANSDEDALLFHPDGTLWVKLHPWWPPPGGITHPRAVYARVDVEAKALVDTVFTPANAAEDCPTLSVHPFAQGGFPDTRVPWVPLTMWTWGPDGTFALGCPARYQFTVTKPAGETLKISRDWTPVPEVKEALLYAKAWSDLKNLPATLPAYRKIILPGDGRIWVWPSQPSRSVEARPRMAEIFGITVEWVRATTGTFDVFGPDGGWVAVVRPPEDVPYTGLPTGKPVVIRGDTLWAIARDSLDVNYLVRAEIVRPGSGS